MSHHEPIEEPLKIVLEIFMSDNQGEITEDMAQKLFFGMFPVFNGTKDVDGTPASFSLDTLEVIDTEDWHGAHIVVTVTDEQT